MPTRETRALQAPVLFGKTEIEIECARQEDLELLEITPLALTQDGSLVVCDAKLIRDDSAAFRHDADEFPTSRMLGERAMTPLERSARQLGPTRRTAGDIVLVRSGAGVAMMMMDLLADHGLRAASFMDNLRGAPDETMVERPQIARLLAARPNIKGIVFQAVMASRSLAGRIEALWAWIGAEPVVGRPCGRSRHDTDHEHRSSDRQTARAWCRPSPIQSYW